MISNTSASTFSMPFFRVPSVYKIGLGLFLVALIWILFTRNGVNDVNSSGGPVLYQGQAPKVQVEVYYEVMCPDSRYFILHNLYVAWEKLQDIFDIHFKPYGKATHRMNPQGAYAFECQHGPMECSGNMLHACAIKYIRSQDTLVEFIKCMMTDSYEVNRGQKCADELELDYKPINTCFKSLEGQKLLASYGDDTHSLRPKISFIPTVVVNGRQDGQPDMLKNLTSFICHKYKGKKPSNCLVKL